MNSAHIHQQLERLFNIRQGEGLLVRQLFLHNFFQGTGIAFFFTAANVLFLDSFSVKWLPWMYLLAGALLIVTGRIYAYFEHHLRIRQLMFYVVGILIASPVLFYIGLSAWELSAIIFVLMASHRVLYTLNSLEFWGLSALAFDVQQSKRIFPLISAGDIPAKLLGYLSIVVLVPYTGIEALLLFSSGCFLLSFVFLQQLLNAKGEHFNPEDQLPDLEQSKIERPKVLLKSVFRSHFLFWLSMLAIFTLLTLTLLDYSFLSEVKYSFKEKKELGQFFGILFSVGYGLIILIKFFFSGKIIKEMGVIRSAFILPVFLLIGGIVALLVSFLSDGHSLMLWIFSAMVIGVDVIRYSIDDPNLMTLFQPLSRSLRLFGHTLIKSLMQPTGLMIAAVILLALLYSTGQINLQIASGLLVLGSIILIVIGYRIKYHYIKQLHKAVRTRYFEGSELLINDPGTQTILENQIETGNARQSIHSLELLNRVKPQHWPDILSKALDHASPEVRAYAIHLIKKGKIKGFDDKLIHILKNDPSIEVQKAVIRAIPVLAPRHIDIIYPYLNTEDPTLRVAVYSTLLSSQYLEAVVLAGEKTLQFIRSSDKEDLTFACKVIAETGNANDYHLIMPLFQNEHTDVQKAAIKAATEIKNPLLLDHLFLFFKRHPEWQELHAAIAGFQQNAMPQIESILSTDKISTEIKIHCCTILAKIKGKQSDQILLSLLKHETSTVRDQALFALKRKGFRPSEKHKELIEGQYNEKIALAFRLLHAEKSCKAESPLLEEALKQNRRKIERQIIDLLEFQFDAQKMQRVRESIFNKHPEFRAKALELLEYELPKDMFVPLAILFDQKQAYDRIIKYDKIRQSTWNYPVDWRTEILNKECRTYDRWTVSMAIFTLENKNGNYNERIRELLQHEQKIIRELAFQYLKRSGILDVKENNMHTQESGNLLLIEKVLLLKNTNIFKEVAEHILVNVAEITRELELIKGERLFKKGDIGDKMYIIASGKISIHDGDHVFSYLEEYGIFGELALLDPTPRSASATAEEDCLLLYIDQHPFFELLSSYPEVAKGILTILGSRLRAQNEEIIRIKQQLE